MAVLGAGGRRPQGSGGSGVGRPLHYAYVRACGGAGEGTRGTVGAKWGDGGNGLGFLGGGVVAL